MTAGIVESTLDLGTDFRDHRKLFLPVNGTGSEKSDSTHWRDSLFGA